MPMQGSNEITAALVKVASEFVKYLHQEIDSKRLSSKIKDAIFIGTPQTNGDISSIEVKIDSPIAVAFEYGSGLHRTRGTPGFVEIVGHPYLAIPRSRWPSYVPPPDVDPVILPRVEHPGVVSRPFVQPALLKNKTEIKEILGKAFKAQILLGLKKETVIEIHVT